MTDPAFRDLYEREFPAVFRAAYALSGDRELAEDAAQEAFARALSRWRRLSGEPWAAGWITTTALNVVRRAMRRRPMKSPERREPVDEEALLDLREAIASLPSRQQTAVVLYYLTGLPVRDVAASMQCREGTVKAHLSKGRAGIERRLHRQVPAETKGDDDG
jgi:RNA polymerase sigma-70 factor (ECF subfamily)